jgi:A/G-specific adenine glycosylase
MAIEPAARRLDPGFVSELQTEILGWYAEHGRSLPWRETSDPYHVLVSELMLQQTQVDRVLPKYQTFLEKFPSTSALAAAPLSDVLVLWSGLGYNRRAKYLWEAVRVIEDCREFPSEVEDLLHLPGVGPYTARAVAVFAFNKDEVLLETNTRRIYQLLFTGDDQREPELMALGHRLLPLGRSRDWHHALMDLGSAAARFRSAKAQQAYLVETFPMLSDLELPKFQADQVVRPRQSEFEGSKRQVRGAVLRELSSGPVSEEDLRAAILDDRLGGALEDLEREGFITRDGEQVRLN